MQRLNLNPKLVFHNQKNEKCYGNRGEGNNTCITYNTVTKAFTTDIHSINGVPGEMIIVVNMDTFESMFFKRTKIDKDGSGEDIYGYNYQCTNEKGTFTLLVIND